MPGPLLRSGIFLRPDHPLDEDPTLAIRRDLELIEWLDKLGYEEAWIGEHHSDGYEMIASPELFIAAAAERTKRIKLGTGVVSLPYHNPFMVADRIVQLDHMTMGRVMFGAGPGLLASDAIMIGIDPLVQRRRMLEALDVILRLFKGETITETTDWFTLRNARLQLLPYTRPYPEVAVASTGTPSGGRAAGKYGLGMLCLAATTRDGFDVLAENWKIANTVAAEHGRIMDPAALRLVSPMHIAPTRAAARANVQFGFAKWLNYFDKTNPARFAHLAGRDPVEALVESGFIVVGTPDDAIAQIRRLQAKQGQFGCLLQLANNWADWPATKTSYELYARYVVPRMRESNVNRVASLAWISDNADLFNAQSRNAARSMFAEHAAEQARKRQEPASGQAEIPAAQ